MDPDKMEIEMNFNEEVLKIIKKLANFAPAPTFIPEDAFSENPPLWAKDEEWGMYGERCGFFNSWCEIVRPGKTQCPSCGDDYLTGIAISAKHLLQKNNKNEK